MIDLKELAVKHGEEIEVTHSDDEIGRCHHVYSFEIEELQAFADEYLALSSSEPVAYGYANSAITGANHKLMMVKLDNSSDQYPELALPLYLANSLNQQLLSERNDLQTQLQYWKDFSVKVQKLADSKEVERNECVEEIRKLKYALEQMVNSCNGHGCGLLIADEALKTSPTIQKLLNTSLDNK
jgi:hypothetical protein